MAHKKKTYKNISDSYENVCKMILRRCACLILGIKTALFGNIIHHFSKLYHDHLLIFIKFKWKKIEDSFLIFVMEMSWLAMVEIIFKYSYFLRLLIL